MTSLIMSFAFSDHPLMTVDAALDYALVETVSLPEFFQQNDQTSC